MEEEKVERGGARRGRAAMFLELPPSPSLLLVIDEHPRPLRVLRSTVRVEVETEAVENVPFSLLFCDVFASRPWSTSLLRHASSNTLFRQLYSTSSEVLRPLPRQAFASDPAIDDAGEPRLERRSRKAEVARGAVEGVFISMPHGGDRGKEWITAEEKEEEEEEKGRTGTTAFLLPLKLLDPLLLLLQARRMLLEVSTEGGDVAVGFLLPSGELRESTEEEGMEGGRTPRWRVIGRTK